MADEQMMSAALDLTEVEAELCRLPEVTTTVTPAPAGHHSFAGIDR